MRHPVPTLAAAMVAGATLIAATPVVTPVASPSVPLEQDDAGTGRDAGTTFETAIPIDRGVEYDATLLPADGEFGVGDEDGFTFEAEAGESVTVVMLELDPRLLPNCVSFSDEDGRVWEPFGCPEEFTFVAPHDGTYMASWEYFFGVPTSYRFVIDPEPVPGDPLYRDIGDARWMTPDPDAPTVVVAVADTGVNPYHEAYHRPLLTEHPCTWVAGFDDCSIPALELSIGEYDSYEEAYEADLDTWRSVEVGQWYWIPRTNIIGAVCDGRSNARGTPPPVTDDTPCIHDEHGHGTGTTSSVLSEAPEALLLVHEGTSIATEMFNAPVAADIRSHSWGPPAPLPLHAKDPVLYSDPIGWPQGPDPFPETIFFLSAGNEAPFPTMLDENRVEPDVQVVGGAFPGKAALRSWSTYDYASWFCRPTAVAASIDGVNPDYCGTSFSAPTVAGTAAAALLELRRREGHTGRSTAEMVTPSITREAFLHALRTGATYDAEQRFDNENSLAGEVEMPAGKEHLFWGFGWLDATRVDAIVACAADGDCPAKSAEAEEWNATRMELRHRMTDPLL